jgi:hypothetical protein
VAEELLEGNTSGIWQDVKWAPDMVRVWTPHLFLRWNSHRLHMHSIYHNKVGRFWWSKLDKFGVAKGLFGGFRPLHSPTLPKQATLPSLAAKLNPSPPAPLLHWLTIMPYGAHYTTPRSIQIKGMCFLPWSLSCHAYRTREQTANTHKVHTSQVQMHSLS